MVFFSLLQSIYPPETTYKLLQPVCFTIDGALWVLLGRWWSVEVRVAPVAGETELVGHGVGHHARDGQGGGGAGGRGVATVEDAAEQRRGLNFKKNI